MAAKDNDSPSEIDKTSFWWAGLCGICHPGGGPTEFDRDGELFFDQKTNMFGYEKQGLLAEDVILDGDYCEVSNADGSLRAAPWHMTGVAEADCLMCHRADRNVNGQMNMNWIWRAATLRRKDKLVDDAGEPVLAYSAAATAGQGWFSNMAMANTPAGKPPMATTLQIDYRVGLNDGSLAENDDGELILAPSSVSDTPKDQACWGCHALPDMKKRGRIWFDPSQDVHYAAFNNLADQDPGNDIAASESRACAECHPSGMDHDIAKGNAFLGSVKNHKDYTNFRTCADCHLEDSPVRHPQATVPSGSLHSDQHLAIMSCESCHVPYKVGEADFLTDNSATGGSIGYKAGEFYSADPLNPDDADKSRWWPHLVKKVDKDGATRLYPAKLLLSAWWGDWDTKGTPEKTDDIIRPIPLWRVRQITGGAPLQGVTDDNGDGKPDVNRRPEILAYVMALKGKDTHGNPVALNPVLVKGGRVWHENQAGDDVESFDYEHAGVHTESSHPFAINHNVLPATEALGAGNDCAACHKGLNGGKDTPVFDRLILIDPFDEDGNPVYKTLRSLTGVHPF